MVNYFIQLAVGYSDAKLPYSHPEASGLYSEAYTQVLFIFIFLFCKFDFPFVNIPRLALYLYFVKKKEHNPQHHQELHHLAAQAIIITSITINLQSEKETNKHNSVHQGLHHLAAHASSPDPWQYAAQATATSSYHRSVQVGFDIVVIVSSIIIRQEICQ